MATLSGLLLAFVAGVVVTWMFKDRFKEFVKSKFI